jgi:murein DD-endopeptidase MepM/ murein hydrolase activator NlpD
MKKLLALIFLLQFLNSFSQKNTKVYYERKGDTMVYYADNQELYPISFVFAKQPELENMRSPETFKITQVFPSKSVRNKVAYFVVNDKTQKWGVKKMPGYMMYIGDVTIKNFDSNYQYDLPFKKGKSFTIFQGYNGTFSHQNENSLDFTMPEGTEILAARDGLVVDFVSHNNTACPTRNCADKANYITILHPDGTFAQYYHLKQNGVKVNIGDQVKKGDVIGLSGNTGWSKGPHLHFVTYLSSTTDDKLMKTLKTLFRTGNGNKAEYLVEKKTYSKEY